MTYKWQEKADLRLKWAPPLSGEQLRKGQQARERSIWTRAHRDMNDPAKPRRFSWEEQDQ